MVNYKSSNMLLVFEIGVNYNTRLTTIKIPETQK